MVISPRSLSFRWAKTSQNLYLEQARKNWELNVTGKKNIALSFVLAAAFVKKRRREVKIRRCRLLDILDLLLSSAQSTLSKENNRGFVMAALIDFDAGVQARGWIHCIMVRATLTGFFFFGDVILWVCCIYLFYLH